MHPEVASIGYELTVFNRYIFPLVHSYEIEQEVITKGKWKQGLPLLWTREKLDKFILDFLDNIYSSVNIQPQHKIVLDKHPAYSHHVELIQYYFPKAKFIHIIRDGRDVAYSWKKVYYSIGFGNPDFIEGCLDWVKSKNDAKKAKKYAPNYYELRYEDLISDFSKGLVNTFSFCGLSFTPELLKSIIMQTTGEENMVSVPDKSIAFSDRLSGKKLWKTHLSKEEMYLAKKYMQAELIEEGYEKNANWGLGPINTFVISMKLLTRKIYTKIMNNLTPLND
jgi:hypothetical protein